VSNGAFATISHSTIEGNECDVSSCGANALTDYQAGGVLFYGAKDGSAIRSCVIKDNDYGVYFSSQDPTLSSSTENAVEFSTVSDNRYENVLLDQGRDLVASDRVEGGDVGIMLLQYDGQSYGDYDTVVSSVLNHSTLAAIQILSDKAATGDLPGSLKLESTSVHGAILSNASSYTITH